MTEQPIQATEAETEALYIRPDYKVLYGILARKLAIIHSSFITEVVSNGKAFATACEAMELIDEVEKLENKNPPIQQQQENN